MVAVLTAGGATGNMAAMVGHDRVTASYPGFHLVKGDATALAASGPDRKMRNGWGRQDAIVVRKVATLTASQALAFDLDDARRIATRHERREGFQQTVQLHPFIGEEKIVACGRLAFGFARMEHITMPVYDAPQVSWTDFDIFVVALVGRDVWQVEYTRLYAPSLEEMVNSLIAFTSTFCVQQGYPSEQKRAQRRG